MGKAGASHFHLSILWAHLGLFEAASERISARLVQNCSGVRHWSLQEHREGIFTRNFQAGGMAAR